MKKILLLTGGLDSTYIFLSHPEFDEYVYVDYGQEFFDVEIDKVQELVDAPIVITLDRPLDNDNGFFCGRNLKILLAVRDSFKDDDIAVYFGNTIDDNYPDNQLEFLQKVASVINDSYKKSFKVVCPLANMSKQQIAHGIVEYSPELMPHWCDKDEDAPCGECHSCLAMKEAHLWEIFVK